ncbi:uncharacterized protein DUF4297 [Roseimicrobium gellanilyticum]|uniref:Uncharacterized protein DUF4297 n=1 Tax=Roseimicrobium gellanilyticum TaxID=748857 RepID=A0A366HGY6_9BACT|nr:dsDNA nuclease domain-containing protein [Roseimicrobium gellanilyticum]RBP41451.1 uncharacterized protein DUF4297 [Roseimicrobium gellanilyticum]
MLDEFVAKKPRESAGTRSSNRFDYQLSWAFCLLLNMEKSGRDYLLVLDYHDDVVVFDSETAPSKADFYQVKTDTRNRWTLTRLLEKAGDSTHSILGKLYGHRLEFAQKASTLNFVSNQLFSLKTLKSPDRASDVELCTLAELCADSLLEIKHQLKAEHALSEDPVIGLEVILKREEIIAAGHKLYAEGALSRFLSEQYGNKPYSVSHAFTALIDLLRRRSHCEDELTSVQDLKLKKSVGRAEFRALIEKVGQSASSETWRTMEALLIQGGTNMLKLSRYKNAWNTREVELLDPSNLVVQSTQREIERVVERVIEAAPDASIVDWLNEANTQCLPVLERLGVPLGDDQMTGAILSSISTEFQ